MLSAICVTILATSSLSCEVGPEERIQALFKGVYPVGSSAMIELVDPSTGNLQPASKPFIVREGDPKWLDVLAASK